MPKPTREQLEKVNRRVKKILQDIPATRGDDLLLAAVYCERHYGTSNLTELSTKEDKPCMESISRSRRKIQAEDDSLQAEPEIVAARAEAETTFSETYKS